MKSKCHRSECGETDGVWMLQRGEKKNANARETIQICILLFCIKSWNKNTHADTSSRLDLVRRSTQKKAIDMYSYRILYQKDVPNQITNFNVKKTSNKQDAAPRHPLVWPNRSSACVRMCACSSHFHIYQRKHKKERKNCRSGRRCRGRRNQ